MENVIVFAEKQNKIYLGKNKITPSSFGAEYLDLHIVQQENMESGYFDEVWKEVGKGENKKMVLESQTPYKFSRVVTFENKYTIEELRSEIENGLIGLMCFENGGRRYIKKEF